MGAAVVRGFLAEDRRRGVLVGIPGGREVHGRNHVEENGMRRNGQRQSNAPCPRGGTCQVMKFGTFLSSQAQRKRLSAVSSCPKIATLNSSAPRGAKA